MIAAEWRLVDERGAGGFLYVDRGPGFDYLQVEPAEHAALIAAAPDLLARLQAMLTPLEDMADRFPLWSVTRKALENECAAIRAAIAKTQETPT